MTDRDSTTRSLREFLDELEARGPESSMELGLDRVRAVFDDLVGQRPLPHVFTVAGTNGKGSTVAWLEALASACGRSCLAFTSPHLLRVNERFRIDGAPVDDVELLAALRDVERARKGRSLTWFEHMALAAFPIALRAGVDCLVLEVGLGGRLDAVNVVDADVALITSIGLDHQRWLGRTRSAIAREKCGIARPGRPIVVAERRPPRGMLEFLDELGARTWRPGAQFAWRWHYGNLDVRVAERRIAGLRPGIAGRHQGGNVAAALAAITASGWTLPGDDALRESLAAVRIPGRFQRVARRPDVFVDVAHNAQAARALADLLERRDRECRAVFAAYADKPVEAIARAVRKRFVHWYVAGTSGPRGQSASAAAERVRAAGVGASVETVESVTQGIERAREAGRDVDAVVVFGSFQTAATALHHYEHA
ncbi:MAG: folylpolyglutamate synthase/dihydrofolate synthase family protein [Wenzhouxiangellaceae bacterium]|nr:folylpolyglutamate synthase/dihydrofolate synthase family protein [Wenzhouxiangellaceae bacterium]